MTTRTRGNDDRKKGYERWMALWLVVYLPPARLDCPCRRSGSRPFFLELLDLNICLFVRALEGCDQRAL